MSLFDNIMSKYIRILIFLCDVLWIVLEVISLKRMSLVATSIWDKVHGGRYRKLAMGFQISTKQNLSLHCAWGSSSHWPSCLQIKFGTTCNYCSGTRLPEYFQRIYVGKEYLIAERFDRATWNMYQRVKEQLPRTNNAVEGFHSAFAKDIKDHPPVTVLSQKYRKVQHHKANMRKQHLDGAKLPPVRRTYQKVTASIRRQVERFDNGLIENLVYLEQVAKVMTINTE